MSEPEHIFVPETVLKRDHFSETVVGHSEKRPDLKLVMRRLDTLPVWTRWLARLLARREARALAAVDGIEGVPVMLRADRSGILRVWSDGAPLQQVRPKDGAWYADARRLLREMHRRGVTHNDVAKPQNWIVRPDGLAAVIDFRLASVHRRKGRLYRLAAYEDLRHLAKQKRTFAPSLLTPTERRILAQRSLPSRVWKASGKRLYLLVTRGMFSWSDSEGAGRALDEAGPAIEGALRAAGGVRDAALVAYPRPSRGVGIYAFVESDAPAEALRAAIPKDRAPDLLQCVPSLPRQRDGAIHRELLELVATNQLDGVAAMTRDDPDLAARMAPIVAGRLNLSDRNLGKARA